MNDEGFLVSINETATDYHYFYNISDSFPEDNSALYPETAFQPQVDAVQQMLETLVRGLHLYYTPSIGFLGFFFNLFGIYLVTRDPFSLESTCHYLLAILLSSSIYMLTVLHHWMNEHEIYFYGIGGWCQFVTFAMQTADFTSTWNVVALCVDRFVAIRFPGFEAKYCTVWRARVVIITLQIIAIVVYLNISILYGVLQYGGRKFCTVLPQFTKTFQVLIHLHSIVNCLLPTLINLILTGAMVEHKLHLSCRVCWRWRDRQRRGGPILLTTREIVIDEDRSCLAIICSFVLFHLPLFLAYVYFTIRTLSSTSYHMTLKDFLWQQAFLQLKYTSYAINLLIMIFTRCGYREKIVGLGLCCVFLLAPCRRGRAGSGSDPHADTDIRTDDAAMDFLSDTRQTIELLNP